MGEALRLEVVVVGCARSGTLSTTKGVNKMYQSLASAALPGLGDRPNIMTHEGVFRLDEATSYTDEASPMFCDHEGFFDWLVAERAGEPFLECSWLMVPWMPRVVGNKTTVFHLVRSPRDQIRSNLYSFMWEGWPWGKFARNFLTARGVDLPDDPTVEAALYWLHWNLAIEEAVAATGAEHRILLTEQVDAIDFAEILSRYLGRSFVDYRLARLGNPKSYWDLSERAKRRHVGERWRPRSEDTFEMTDLPEELRKKIEDLYEHRYLRQAVNAAPRRWPFPVARRRPII